VQQAHRIDHAIAQWWHERLSVKSLALADEE
jgi:hypothetical protein